MWCSVVMRMGVVCTPLRSKELDSVTHKYLISTHGSAHLCLCLQVHMYSGPGGRPCFHTLPSTFHIHKISKLRSFTKFYMIATPPWLTVQR